MTKYELKTGKPRTKKGEQARNLGLREHHHNVVLQRKWGIFKNHQTYGITRGECLALEKPAQYRGLKEGGFMRFIGEFFRDLRTPLYRNAVFLMANSLANNMFGFFFWMVVAWFYSVSDFGLAVGLIAAVMLIASLSRLGLEVGLIRYLPEAGEKEKSMINSSFTITGGLAVVTAIVFVAGVGFWSPALDFLVDNMFFVVAFVLFVLFFAFMPLMDSVFVAKRTAKYVLYKNLVYGFVRLGLPVVFVVGLGVFGIFASWGIGALVALMVGLVFFMRKVVPEYRPVPTLSRAVVNDMLHFSFGNYIGGIFVLLPGLILPLMILHVMTEELTAYFYVAWMIAGILYIIPGAVTMSLYAEGSHSQGNFVRDIRKSLKLIFGLMVIGISVTFFFGNYFLALFGAGFSQGAFDFLRIMALSGFFVSINGIYATMKRVQKQVLPIILVFAAVALGTLGIAYLSLSSIGLVGVGLGWIASQGIVSLGIGVVHLRKFLATRRSTLQ